MLSYISDFSSALRSTLKMHKPQPSVNAEINMIGIFSPAE